MKMMSKETVRKLWFGSFAMILCTSLVPAALGESLSKAAEKGEPQMAVCNACHDASLNPPKGPPLFGIQRRYQRQYSDKEAFVEAIVDFVNNPTQENALMQGPVRMLGLMPALPLGDESLGQIASFIFESTFPPPCDHWENALSSNTSSSKKGGGGKGHRRQDQMMYDKFCQ